MTDTDRIEVCKKEISEILANAIDGTDKTLRFESPVGGSFVRWGLVEKRIHAAIEKLMEGK